MNEIVIIPLGTVSPYCKDDKNCPGFLIKYKNYNILLDCGNGISRYLEFPKILDNLYIFISHMHKDHYGDINTIEYSSYVYNNLGQLNKKVKIYTPKSNIIYNNINFCEYRTITNDFSIFIDDLKITFHDNKSHGIESYMICLENSESKIVYTSDVGNGNLNDVITFCENSDLLICESSLLKEHRKSKNHLTAYEAGLIAKHANVKKLLLTHFWPEIKKEEYLEEALEVFDNTLVAEENRKLILSYGKRF